MSLILLLRTTLAFCWIYHGLFPKLLTIAPIEQAITATAGFDQTTSYWITKLAGVGEVLFGIILFYAYRNTKLLYLNMAALLGLLIYVAVFAPQFLLEAFNPMTTNITMIVIILGILKELEREAKQ